MKTKLLFALGVALFLTCQSSGQCVVNFNWTQTANNIISFTDATTGITANANFNWNFGDGNYSVLQNPVHTYNVPGNYNVCLYVTDSLICASTYCATITVTGTVICVMTVSMDSSIASCPTCPDGSAEVMPYNGTPPFTYSWNTVPVQTTYIATGLLPGTYTCCVTDANGCTACGTTTIVSSTCTSNFTYSQAIPNTISFTNTSTGTTPNTIYYWTFGDANYSFAQNPTHYYTVAGNYNVCFTVSDSAVLCADSVCMNVTVTGANCSGYSVVISTVNSSCGTCSNGSATANPLNGTAPYSYAWSTSATTQSITNLGAGAYSCCVTDANGCYACASGFVDTNNTACAAFFTLSSTPTPHTYNAVNLATGTPPINYLWSWGDGNYDYTAFPTHTYANAGFYNVCLDISDTTGCHNSYCFYSFLSRFEAANAIVTINVVPSTVGINPPVYDDWLTIKTLADDNLVITFSLASSCNIEVKLFDTLGKVFKKSNQHFSEGVHENNLDVGFLPAGIYFITVTDEKNNSVTKKIVKM